MVGLGGGRRARHVIPDNELRLGRENEKEKVRRYNRWDEQEKNDTPRQPST